MKITVTMWPSTVTIVLTTEIALNLTLKMKITDGHYVE